MHIEVDSHTHTIAAGHAYSTLSENISAAEQNNIRLLAMTEHGPSMPGAPHVWFFHNLRVIPRRMGKVALLRGIEANILNNDGEIDIDNDLTNQLDLIIGSLHEPIYMPSDALTHTKAAISAITAGKIDILGHAGNPTFPIDYREVARAAAHHHVLIEINNSSFTTSRTGSKQNCARLAEAVADCGGLLTFGSDAHLAANVGAFAECIAFVKELGIPEECVISCSAERFLALLQARKQRDFNDLYAALNNPA